MIDKGLMTVLGIGAIAGAYSGRKSLGRTQELFLYAAGGGLVLLSLAGHMVGRHRWGGHHHPGHYLHRRGGHHEDPDYSILGGREMPYDFMMRQELADTAAEAGTINYPERQPPGYLTGIGMEQSKHSMQTLYSYPQNIYESGTKRVTMASPV
jgi:hypothetical protein